MGFLLKLSKWLDNKIKKINIKYEQDQKYFENKRKQIRIKYEEKRKQILIDREKIYKYRREIYN